MSRPALSTFPLAVARVRWWWPYQGYFRWPRRRAANTRRAGGGRVGADADAIDDAVTMINAAKYPIVISGEMVSWESAFEELKDFADASGVGVLTAYRQQDTFPSDHPANYGHLSINRLPFQNEALKDCDLLISVGCRLDSVSVDDYKMIRPDQKLIMIYPEPSEFSQYQSDVAIGSNVVPALKAITEKLAPLPKKGSLGAIKSTGQR